MCVSNAGKLDLLRNVVQISEHLWGKHKINVKYSILVSVSSEVQDLYFCSVHCENLRDSLVINRTQAYDRTSVCVLLTTDAHSCNVPTTGMSMFLCGDLSRRPSRGIPPACRMASLFLLVLLQLHKARAPQRATSTSRCCFSAVEPETQSNSLT